MTIPAAATKVHLDAGTDDPKQARVELADLVDKFNTLKDHVAGIGGGSEIDGGSQTSVSSVDIADPTFADYLYVDVSGSIRPAASGKDAIMQISTASTVRTSGYDASGQQIEGGSTERAIGGFSDGFWIADRATTMGVDFNIRIVRPGAAVTTARMALIWSGHIFNFSSQYTSAPLLAWNSSHLGALDQLRLKLRDGSNFDIDWVMTGALAQ